MAFVYPNICLWVNDKQLEFCSIPGSTWKSVHCSGKTNLWRSRIVTKVPAMSCGNVAWHCKLVVAQLGHVQSCEDSDVISLVRQI